MCERKLEIEGSSISWQVSRSIENIAAEITGLLQNDHLLPSASSVRLLQQLLLRHTVRHTLIHTRVASYTLLSYTEASQSREEYALVQDPVSLHITQFHDHPHTCIFVLSTDTSTHAQHSCASWKTWERTSTTTATASRLRTCTLHPTSCSVLSASTKRRSASSTMAACNPFPLK